MTFFKIFLLFTFSTFVFSNDIDILSYCTVKYQNPMNGAGIWQKPTIPIILIPGIGGSMLHSNHDEPIKLWLSITRQEVLGTEYLSSTFNYTNGSLKGRFYDNIVKIRNDFHGLCSIDNLDPDLIIPSASRYYHMMINWATSLGYEPGKTLFGFPYDWRRSLRDKTTHQSLMSLIDKVSRESPTGKLDVVTHSMGGNVLKSLLGENISYQTKIRKWLPIGTPWLGSSVAFQACIKGYNLDLPFGLSESVAKQLEFGWPPTFELLPHFSIEKWGNQKPWISYKIQDQVVNSTSEADIIQLFHDVNVDHYFERLTTNEKILQPFDLKMYEYTRETRRRLDIYGDIIRKSSVEVHNFVSDGVDTKFSMHFNENVNKSVRELKDKTPTFTFSQGDGTVPFQSSIANGMGATDYILGEPVEHLKLVESTAIMNAGRNILGLSCKMEGHWNVTIKGKNEIIILDHTHQVMKPRRRLLMDYEIGFIRHANEDGSMIMSQDCLSFKGEIGIREWQGVRIIGKDCSPLEMDATGRECVYGRWSTKTN